MKNKVFVAATNNPGKLKEIDAVLRSAGYEVVSMKDAGVSCDPDETGKSFIENALIKAKAIKELTPLAVISDDSGLMVEALGGLPGVYTARYAGEDHDDEKNIDKLLEKLNGIPRKSRRAWFVSAIAALLPDERTFFATGRVKGYIGTERSGAKGFGYDPVFLFKGNRSFAELTPETKNAVSHRGRALRKIGFMLREIERVRGLK